MITFIFWNIHQRPEAFEYLARMASTHTAHVLLIAEMPPPGEPGLYDSEPAEVLLATLNREPMANLPGFQLVSKQQTQKDQKRDQTWDTVQIYSRLPAQTLWTRMATHSRYAIWQIGVPGHPPFHLAAAHFTSIQNDQGDGQRECAIALRTDLELAERTLHTNFQAYENLDPLSLVIGDLNACPFDPGIVSVYGLNATGLRTTAMEGSRNHQGRRYPYLYNPMWRFLNADPPGSYYKRTDSPIRFDWFLLDQVLVRPALLELFDKGDEPDLRLLTDDGKNELRTAGPKRTPNQGISDHLPLMFRFQLPNSQE